MENPIFIGLLTAASQHGASDIHLQVGSTPSFRIKGDLVSVKCPPLSEVDLAAIVKSILTKSGSPPDAAKQQEYDGSFELPGIGRFRFNLYRHQGKHGIVLRHIPTRIPSIRDLGLPTVLEKIAALPRGLVLVTGATGSGKSSTLAAMIDYLNTNFPLHILTIEDPVEFLHTQKRARVTQREIGRDTANFAGALRAALRQDPDVILVGEMRDAETIDIALKAAETGHLVFSTVHTTDAVKTIGRLISVFPPSEQHMVRLRLAENLVATISQRLVKRAKGSGMVAAQEIMISNKSIQECIEDPARTGGMNDYISKSREVQGGQTFDQHLVELFRDGVITYEAAKEASTNPADFSRNLMYGGGGGGGPEHPNANDHASETVILDHGEDSEGDPSEGTGAA